MVGVLVALELGTLGLALLCDRQEEQSDDSLDEAYGRIREEGHERVRVKSRGLSPLEEREARKVFGDTIDYERVTLKKTMHPWHSFAGGAVLPYETDEEEQEYIYKLLFDRGWLRSVIRSTGERISKFVIFSADSAS